MIFVLFRTKIRPKKVLFLKFKKKRKNLDNICLFRQKNIKTCISNLKCKMMFISYKFDIKIIQK